MSEHKKVKMSSTSLDQLKTMTTIVADTGDFEGIRWTIILGKLVQEFMIRLIAGVIVVD
jgi:hypothetical protein